MSRVYEYYEGDAKEIEGARKEEILQKHWKQYFNPMDKSNMIASQYKIIEKLRRNNDLLKAYLVALSGNSSDVAINDFRNYLEKNQGFPEEF